MGLTPKQHLLVIEGPYKLKRGQSAQQAAAELLTAAMDAYPPSRIVALTSTGLPLHAHGLTAVIEEVD